MSQGDELEKLQLIDDDMDDLGGYGRSSYDEDDEEDGYGLPSDRGDSRGTTPMMTRTMKTMKTPMDSRMTALPTTRTTRTTSSAPPLCVAALVGHRKILARPSRLRSPRLPSRRR